MAADSDIGQTPWQNLGKTNSRTPIDTNTGRTADQPAKPYLLVSNIPLFPQWENLQGICWKELGLIVSGKRNSHRGNNFDHI